MGHFDDDKESVTLLCTPNRLEAWIEGLKSLMAESGDTLDEREHVGIEDLLQEIVEVKETARGQDIRELLRNSGDQNLVELAKTLTDAELVRLERIIS